MRGESFNPKEKGSRVVGVAKRVLETLGLRDSEPSVGSRSLGVGGGTADRIDASQVEDWEDQLAELPLDTGAKVDIWIEIRRRQAQAAKARIERDGPDPEWLANLETELDEI